MGSHSPDSRQQAIIWTNDSMVYTHIYASLGLKTLRPGQNDQYFTDDNIIKLRKFLYFD